MITRSVFMLCLLIVTSVTQAQEVGIGEWRDMLPYNKTTAVEQVGTRIYCATEYSLFYYDTEDLSVQRISKVNGLSDIGVSHIGYNEDQDVLVVGYLNTNIDLIRGNQFTNLSDIKRKEILGNKTINRVMNRGSLAYLSCGFGIVVVDLERDEIKDTYYIGPDGSAISVYDMTFNDTSFFAATEHGIYYADIDDLNLAYFANWTWMADIPQSNGLFNRVHSHNQYLFINYHNPDLDEDELYVLDNGAWRLLDEDAGKQTSNIRTSDGRLMVAYNYFAKEYDDNLDEVLKIYTYGESGNPTPSDMITGEPQHYWIADRNRGLVDVWGGGFQSQSILPSGAPTSEIYSMDCEGGEMWLVPGAMTATWNNQWKSARAYSFIEEDWRTYSQYNTEGLDTIRDVLAVAVDPFNPKRVYAGSWTRGALEFLDGELTNIYHSGNSSLLPSITQGEPVVKVGGIGFDSQGNVWMTNSNTEDLLSVRRNNGTTDGEWQSYHLGASTIDLDVATLVVDSYDQKWFIPRITSSNPNYIYLFNESYPTGQQYTGLRSGTGKGNLPGNAAFSMAVDKDGEMWIGTDEGVAVFYSPDRILTGEEPDAQRILVDFDGYVQYLLETETVKAIAVDGANNKWFGTERAGIFKLTPDGTEQIHHFTAENSPLLANSITSIAINGETGEVYIGTPLGLIAFKDDATEPNDDNSEVYAYPNPVKPGYTGPIAIKGLVSNASVKITDISGTLIYETVAEGGQAVWNGYNFDGKRARSGVYLVFISDSDGSETMVTKIMVIN